MNMTMTEIRRETNELTTATLFLALHSNRFTAKLRKILRDRIRVRTERQNIIRYLGMASINDELNYHYRDLNDAWHILLYGCDEFCQCQLHEHA